MPDQRVRGVLVLVGRVAERVGRVRERFGQRGCAVAVGQCAAQNFGDLARLRRQHGRLVHHPELVQVAGRVEPLRALVAEVVEEHRGPQPPSDDVAQDVRLFAVEHDDGRRVLDAVRKRRAGFFVGCLAVHDDGVARVSQLGAALPDFLHERARRVVGVRVEAATCQGFLHLDTRAEGRHHHDVVRGEFVPLDQVFARGRKDEPYAPVLQVAVDRGVVDHFAEEEDPFVAVLGQRPIGDLDRVFHAETEAEVPGQNEAHRPEVEHRRQMILLARVLELAGFLDPRNHRAFVEVRDVELACHVSPG